MITRVACKYNFFAEVSVKFLDLLQSDAWKVIQSCKRVMYLNMYVTFYDRLCGLVVRVLGYRSEGPGSIPGTTKEKKVVGLERGTLSLVSTTEELLHRKVAAPV
jgi:hypothetical protein